MSLTGPGRWLMLAAGWMALVLGVIGIAVPLLPTTPFLLLAAACFLRSSARLHAWLMGHRWLGPYLRNYRDHRAMSRRAKITALVLLWAVIGHSACMVDAWWLRLILLLVAAGVTLHLLHLRTQSAPPRETPALPPGSLSTEAGTASTTHS